MQLRFKSQFEAFLIAVGLAITTQGVFVVPAYAQAESNDKIKELLQKRLVIATEIHTQQMKAFKGGQLEFKRVLEAQAVMLRAKFDLCETKAERIKAHEEMVKTAEESVKIMQKLHKAAQATQVGVLQAELHLLEAEIALEKAKAAK